MIATGTTPPLIATASPTAGKTETYTHAHSTPQTLTPTHPTFIVALRRARCHRKHGSSLVAVNWIEGISCCCQNDCSECHGGGSYTIAVLAGFPLPASCDDWVDYGPQTPCTEGGPDLVVDAATISESLTSEWLTASDSCYIIEGCLGGTGQRRILRFSTLISNQGCDDFRIGEAPASTSPSDAIPGFVYNECHHHFHYEVSLQPQPIPIPMRVGPDHAVVIVAQSY
jgi:hypothetical protein